MKRLFAVFLSILILFVLGKTKADAQIPPCPTLKLSSPEHITMPGESMKFSLDTANIAESEKLKFKWTVSAGYIIEGQNTSSIRVATTPDLSGEMITAKVTVEGLPDNCSNEASETAAIQTLIACGLASDQYSDISLEDEMGRLDNFFVAMFNNPETKGFVLLSISGKETVGQSKKHIKRIIKHAKFRKFPAEGITFAIEKNSDYHSTSLYIIPANADFPQCNDCEFIKGEK